MTPQIVLLLVPEIILIAAALAIYLGGAFWESVKSWAAVAAGAIVLAAVALVYVGTPNPPAVSADGSCDSIACAVGPNALAPIAAASGAAAAPVRPLVVDHLAVYIRWLALAVGAALVLMTWRPLASGATPEYLGSMLLALAGLMLVAAAGDLVLMLVALELISIPTYILLSLGRRDEAGREAAAKYFYLSVLSSAMFLYGLSFIYGTAGSTQLDVIAQRLAQPGSLPGGFGLADRTPLAQIALVLVIAGLGFRITAVPFHFYAPDVFQGTIHPTAAMLSVLPKAAGLVALVRLVLVLLPDVQPHAWKIVLGLSLLTMTLGNLLALWQDNLRRLLAYSSIANAGYMLLGLAAALVPTASTGGLSGIGATLFYLAAYAAATLGTFAALVYLGRWRQQIEVVDELAGLGQTHPSIAAAIAVAMFSLAGFPPAGGLWGKLLVFGSALSVEAGEGGPYRPWLVAAVIVGVLNAAIAAYYYLRIVGVMYFRAPLAAPRAEGGRGPWLAAVACALVVLVLGVYPGPWIRLANQSSPRPHVGQVANLPELSIKH